MAGKPANSSAPSDSIVLPGVHGSAPMVYRCSKNSSNNGDTPKLEHEPLLSLYSSSPSTAELVRFAFPLFFSFLQQTFSARLSKNPSTVVLFKDLDISPTTIVCICTLQHADDTLILSLFDTSSIPQLLLYCFKLLMGLCHNFNKSLVCKSIFDDVSVHSSRTSNTNLIRKQLIHRNRQQKRDKLNHRHLKNFLCLRLCY